MNLEESFLLALLFVGGFLLLRPLVAAFADRIRHKGLPAADAGDKAEILEELRGVRQEMTELAERMDFAERLLAKQGEAARLASPGGR
jgi:hypothetical protein